jgi:hypothetical protein
MSDSPQQKNASDEDDILVFSILRESKCADCGASVGRGDLMRLEDRKPHCLRCADLDHLVYLGRGDVCLTRRSRKYSALSAVVLKFSRSRNRYERQGLLVEEEALNRAEQECLKDEEARAAARARAEVQRTDADKKLTAQMAEQMRRLFPRAPVREIDEIARHTSVRSSGRVGRTAAGKAFDEAAITAAVVARRPPSAHQL